MPETVTFLLGGVEIAAEAGESVLAAARRAEQSLQTVCKGRGICGACRVLVDEEFVSQLPPPAFSEIRLLKYLKQGEANHRLACQIILDASLNGLRVMPAPLPVQTVT
jgi:ferredoxin